MGCIDPKDVEFVGQKGKIFTKDLVSGKILSKTLFSQAKPFLSRLEKITNNAQTHKFYPKLKQIQKKTTMFVFPPPCQPFEDGRNSFHFSFQVKTGKTRLRETKTLKNLGKISRKMQILKKLVQFAGKLHISNSRLAATRPPWGHCCALGVDTECGASAVLGAWCALVRG